MNDLKKTSLLMRVVLVVAGMQAANALEASLEGSMGTQQPPMASAMVPYSLPISEEERAKEIAQRKLEVAKQIEVLQDRLKRVPNASKVKQLHEAFEATKPRGGFAEQITHVINFPAMEDILQDRDELNPGLLAGFIQFQKDLNARGIDLIVLATPGNPHIYGHTLVDGLGPTDEITPGYKMLLTLLENDIEVVCALDEMRAAATGSLDEVLVHWPNEPHTGPKGCQLVSKTSRSFTAL